MSASSLQKEIEINAPIKTVFDSLTNVTFLTTWFKNFQFLDHNNQYNQHEQSLSSGKFIAKITKTSPKTISGIITPVESKFLEIVFTFELHTLPLNQNVTHVRLSLRWKDDGLNHLSNSSLKNNSKKSYASSTHNTLKIAIPSTAVTASIVLIVLLFSHAGFLPPDFTDNNISSLSILPNSYAEPEAYFLSVDKDSKIASILDTSNSFAYYDAISAYNLQLEQNPNNITALTGKAAVLANQEKYQESISLLNTALEKNPDDLTVRLLRDKVAVNIGLVEYNPILEQYTKALQNNQNNQDIVVAKASLLQNIGEPQTALQIYDVYLQTYPNDDNLTVQLFRDKLAISENLQDSSQIITQYDNTLQDNSEDRDTTLLKANVQKLIGNDMQSFETIADYLANVNPDVEAIKDSTDYSKVSYNTSVESSYDISDNLADNNFFSVFTESNDINNNNVINSIVSQDTTVSLAVADSLLSQYKYDAAETIYREIISKEPNNIAAQLSFDSVLVSQDRSLIESIDFSAEQEQEPTISLNIDSFVREAVTNDDSISIGVPENETIEKYDSETGNNEFVIQLEKIYRVVKEALKNVIINDNDNSSTQKIRPQSDSSMAIEILEDDTIFVLDSKTKSVQVLDSKGTNGGIPPISTKECTFFGEIPPQSIAAIRDHPNSIVYVTGCADSENAIIIFENGEKIAGYDHRNMQKPFNTIEVSPSGAYLYIIDAKYDMFRFDMNRSKERLLHNAGYFNEAVQPMKIKFSENSKFNNPSLVVSNNQASFVVDDDNSRISQVLNGNGKSIAESEYVKLSSKLLTYTVNNNEQYRDQLLPKAKNSISSSSNEPVSLDIQPLLDRDGKVYLLDTNNHKILIPNGFSFNELLQAQKDMLNPKLPELEQKELQFPQDFNKMKCDNNILFSSSSSSNDYKSENIKTSDHLPFDQVMQEANTLSQIPGQEYQSLFLYYIAYQINSGNISAMAGIGYSQNIVCSNDSALETFELILEEYPNDINSLVGVGNYYLLKADSEYPEGTLRIAIEKYKQVLDNIDSQNTNALNGLGTAYTLLEEYNTAIDYFEQSVNLENKITTLSGMAFLHYKMNNFSEAIRYYEKVLDQDPHNYHALSGLYRIYIQDDNATMAQKYLEKLFEHNETIVEDLVNNGKWLDAHNNSEEAQFFFKKALELDHTNKDARSLMDR